MKCYPGTNTKTMDRFIPLLLLLVGIGCQAAEERSSAERALVRLPMLEICRPDGVNEDMLCGRLEVYENTETKNGSTLLLNVVVVPATEESVRPIAMVDLSGGPGRHNAGTERYYVTNEFAAIHRQNRDIVVIDYRGTGASVLDCEAFRGLRAFEKNRFSPEQVAACRDELVHTDLSRYTTDEIVEDLEVVRAWLGYAQYDLIGYSYGTRVALEYARRYPMHVHTMTLSGMVPPDFSYERRYRQDTQRQLVALANACRTDAECQAAFPDVLANVYATRDRLAQQPVTIAHVTEEEDSVIVTIDGFAFETWLADELGDGSGWGCLPAMIHATAAGDYQPLAAALARLWPLTRRVWPLYFSTFCPEVTRRASPASVGLDSTFMQGERARWRDAACAAWVPRDPPAWLEEPAAGSVPTLLFTGEADPVTPPRGADAVAARLAHSRHIVIPNRGHSWVMGIVDCFDRMLYQFHNTADPAAVDASCAMEAQWPPFILHVDSLET